MVRLLKTFVIVVFFAEGILLTGAFCEDNVSTPNQTVKQPSAEQLKAIRQKEENGLNLARQAIEMADPYPELKESVQGKNNQIQELTRRKAALQLAMQKTRVEMNKKASEYANNPRMLEIAKKLYTGKLNEMKQELSEIDLQLPKLNVELTEETLELQAEELTRSRDKDTGDEVDDAFEQAVLERFQNGSKLLNSINLFKPAR